MFNLTRIPTNISLLLVIALSWAMPANACGPNAQKVIKEIIIKAAPSRVWAVVGDFGAMQAWHSDVIETQLETKLDDDGKAISYRKLKLRNGGSIIEKQRETQDGEMKLGSVMVEGDIAVSNYSDAITVRPGQTADESVVTWIGRFNNKADLMQAPVGQDNAAAIAAVEGWFDVGLANLKKVIEAQ